MLARLPLTVLHFFVHFAAVLNLNLEHKTKFPRRMSLTIFFSPLISPLIPYLFGARTQNFASLLECSFAGNS